jgi:multiple antibiotic resistance protein
VDAIVTYAILSFGSLFAILSPFATVPTFLAMTEGNDAAERTDMALRASKVACGVLVVFSLVGMGILQFFRVTVPAFQIAGGLVILRVSFEMLQGSRALKVTPEERREGEQKDDIAITPLAVPITTGILLSSQAQSWFQTGVLVGNVILIYAITFALLRFAAHYSNAFGEITLKIITRLMGLLLLAIAVQFIVDGIRASGLPGGL